MEHHVCPSEVIVVQPKARWVIAGGFEGAGLSLGVFCVRRPATMSMQWMRMRTPQTPTSTKSGGECWTSPRPRDAARATPDGSTPQAAPGALHKDACDCCTWALLLGRAASTSAGASFDTLQSTTCFFCFGCEKGAGGEGGGDREKKKKYLGFVHLFPQSANQLDHT